MPFISGQLKVDEFVTHESTLSKINDGFNTMKAGDCSMCLFLRMMCLKLCSSMRLGNGTCLELKCRRNAIERIDHSPTMPFL